MSILIWYIHKYFVMVGMCNQKSLENTTDNSEKGLFIYKI